jgi:hypothetical protein
MKKAVCLLYGHNVDRPQAITGPNRPLSAVLALVLKEKRIYS